MRQRPTLKWTILAHITGVLLYILIAVVGAIAYLAFHKATGPPMEPMVGGAILVIIPMILAGFGLLVWAPTWSYLKWKFGAVFPRQAAGCAALLAVLGAIVFCGGFACFLGGRSEHFVGWFLVAYAALGAAAHSAMVQRLTRRRSET